MAEYGIGSVTLNTGTNKVTANNVTGALGGVLELWEEPGIIPVETHVIDADPKPEIEFSHNANEEKCYYAIAREAAPSPNFDMKFVENTNCASPVEMSIDDTLGTRGQRPKKVTVNLNLNDVRYKAGTVHISILTRKRNAGSFNTRSMDGFYDFVGLELGNTGEIEEIRQILTEDHVVAVVFAMIEPPDAKLPKLRYCRRTP